MDAPSVSVIVVTYNSAELIGPCLQSLQGSSSLPIELIVVDNHSTDRTVDAAMHAFPQLTLIKNSTNRYYAAATNQGLREAHGQYVLLLNPDATMPEGGIDTLVRELDAHPGAGAIAPMLVSPDGQRQLSLREFPGLDTLWYDLTGLSKLFPRSRSIGRLRMGYFDGLTARLVEQPMASCLLIRRSVIDQVGEFDESYPMFFNDVDWCRRANAQGEVVWYTPEVKVAHHGGATVKKYRSKMIWMSHAAYFRYLRRLYARSPIMLALTCLSWPPLMLAALARYLWHVIMKSPS